jgi:hypothetical protein
MEESRELQVLEPERVEVMQVDSAEALMAQTRSEIDVQIATAKQFPRNLAQVLNNIETLATMDEETASSCFYMLRRQGKLIEGASVRMAEIIASSWGNIRVQSRIIGNDGKMITAQGVCHDLESNYAVSAEVKRRITDKNGHTFSEDMQVVTGNAACAIAMRNALFKVVPMALVKKVINKAKKVSLGEATSLEETRTKMLNYFQTIGVDQQHLFDYLSVEKIDEIDTDMCVELRGLATAIKEGTTTIQETFFPKPAKEAVKEENNPQKDLFGNDGKEPEKEPKTKKGDK